MTKEPKMQPTSFMHRSVSGMLAGALFAALLTFGIGTAKAAAVLEIAKIPNAGTVAAGGVATFTITVTNTGDETSPSFGTIVDPLPGLDLVWDWDSADPLVGCGIFTNTPWAPPAQQVLECDFNSIPAGGSRTLTVFAETPLDACRELNNTATVYYSSVLDPTDAIGVPSASDSGSISVTSNACRPLFVVGDVEPHAVGDVVNFWGAQWWKNNFMSGFVSNGVASFKGYASSSDNFCGLGATWESRPGNSSKPPATIPDEVMVIVTDTVHKDGPDITGTILQILLVRSDGGYGPAPGHRGNGEVLEILCPLP